MRILLMFDTENGKVYVIVGVVPRIIYFLLAFGGATFFCVFSISLSAAERFEL